MATDQVGNTVPLAPVHRLVTLAPDVTELAFAVGAGAIVTAVPPAADFPPEAARLPRVAPADVEAIVGRAPDMVFATTAGNEPRVVERLRALGIRVCTFDVTTFARLAAACRLAGEVLGSPEAGERLAREVEGRVTRATAAAASLAVRRTVFVVWWDPLIVASPGTFPDDLLRRARLENAAPPSMGRYPRVDPEILLDPRLEVVVAPDEPELRAGFERLARSPAGSRLASGRLRAIWLPADLVDRPGPRLPAALEVLVAAREEAERQGPGHRAQGTGERHEERGPRASGDAPHDRAGATRASR